MVDAALALLDEVPRHRREHRVARSRQVVVDRVAVRVRGHRAVAADRADADHVWQRGGVMREPPRRRGRLRTVSDRGNHDDALRVGVLDRRLLERRVRVELRVERVANAAEAEVDHARALVDRPANRGHLALERDLAVSLDDLCDHELRVEREPCDPLVVGRVRGDLPGDERAVTLRVAVGRAADERLRGDDTPHQIRMAAVDARVDHRNPDRETASVAPARRTTRCPARGTTASPRAAPCCRTRATRQAARVRVPRPRARAAVSRHRDRSREAGREAVARYAADAVGARREHLGEAEGAAGVGGAARKRRPHRARLLLQLHGSAGRAPDGSSRAHRRRSPVRRPAARRRSSRARRGPCRRRGGTASPPVASGRSQTHLRRRAAGRRPASSPGQRSSLPATRRPRRARSPSARRRRRR